MDALLKGVEATEQIDRKRAGDETNNSGAKKVPKVAKTSDAKSPSVDNGGEESARDGGRSAGEKRKQKEEHQYPVQPRTIVVIKKPRTVMNHSYMDFSQVPAADDYVHPEKIEHMTFSQKVHHILSQEEYAPYISWCSHGRAFKISIPKIFEQQICGKYFGHSRYSSFLRLLNNYGFKHLTQGTDRNCYYHECMLRGMPHLAQYMPKPRNARRLIPDPENEPDFYKMSKMFPLDSNSSPDGAGVDVDDVDVDGDDAAFVPVAPGNIADGNPRRVVSYEEKPRTDIAGTLRLQSALTTQVNVPATTGALLQQLSNSAAATGILDSLATPRTNLANGAARNFFTAAAFNSAAARPPVAAASLAAALGAPAAPNAATLAAASTLATTAQPGALSRLSSLSLSNAALLNRRQQLLQQAAALETQAQAIGQETALLNAALGLQQQRQQGNNFFGGLPF